MKVVSLLLLSFYICIATGTKSVEESVSSQTDETYLNGIVDKMEKLSIGDNDRSYDNYEKSVMELY